MPKYIFDTDICIYWLKGDRRIEKKITAVGLESISITVITECELFYGACKSAKTEKNLAVLKELRKRVKVLEASSGVAPLYAKTKARLEKTCKTLDDADLLIASITMAAEGILVTNNTAHFSRIPSLRMENWSNGQ